VAVPSSRRDPWIDPALIDPALIDSSLGEEVDLLARLIVAANASDCRLDPAALDAALFSDESDAATTPPLSEVASRGTGGIVPPCRACGAEVIIEFGRGDQFGHLVCTNPTCPTKRGDGQPRQSRVARMQDVG
jgi:hypothetical protein